MFKKILRSYDYTLVAAIVLLSIFGLVMVYSASMASAVQRYGVASDYFYQKQKLSLLGAAFLFIVASGLPYKLMRSNKILAPMVFFSLFGLMTLFVFGHVAGNAQSWFKVAGFGIQPSEFVKLCVIIYLSAVYAKKQAYIDHFNKGVAPPLAYLVLVCVLIAIQPDFGTAGIIAAIAATIVLSSGMSFRNFLKLAGIGMIGLIPILIALQGEIFSSKRVDRFAVLKNPFAVEQTSGYHLANSYIAIGSGGVNGLGLGHGIEKLGYLPESHTDFIMAVIAEELGIWGVGFVIILLGYIVLRGIYIALQCKDPFGSLLAIGISAMIGIQSFVNLAGVSGLIPLTGVPLPFISYGGSSLIQLALATGILVNVSMFVNYEKKYKNKTEQKNSIKKQAGNVFHIRS
jgi:cell division protein FtsW